MQALVLAAVWLTLSGLFDAFHLALGLASVLLVLWINRGLLPPSRDPDAAGLDRPLHPARMLLYLPWLAWQMVLAAWHVATVILAPGRRLAPRMVRFRSRQPNDLARVILGNSITLTPGTITLEIEGDEFLVHALTASTAGGLLEGTMPRRVARLFVNEPADMVTDAHTEPPA